MPDNSKDRFFFIPRLMQLQQRNGKEVNRGMIDSPRSLLRGLIDYLYILFVLANPEVGLRGTELANLKEANLRSIYYPNCSR